MGFELDLAAIRSAAGKRKTDPWLMANVANVANLANAKQPPKLAGLAGLAISHRTATPPKPPQSVAGLAGLAGLAISHGFEDRSTCPACTHYPPTRKQCLNYRRAGLTEPSVAAAIAHLQQRCPGHAAKP